MKKTTSQIGWEAEEKAASYLRKLGYTIRDRQFRCLDGELDIVAVKKGRTEEEDHLSFVEVKYRSRQEWGRPFEAVDWRKRKKLMKAAARYQAINPWKGTLSFDIIEVTGRNMEQIRYFKNAFCPGGSGGE